MNVVAHEMGFAREISHPLVSLHQGRIEEQGRPREVLARPTRERLRALLSSTRK